MTSISSAARRRAVNLAWLTAYVVTIVAIVVVVIRVRDMTLREMGTAEAQAEWQAWREIETDRANEGPVRRRPPVVSEPPALLMMRDHFPVVMAGSVTFASLFFALTMFAARGLAKSGDSDLS